MFFFYALLIQIYAIYYSKMKISLFYYIISCFILYFLQYLQVEKYIYYQAIICILASIVDIECMEIPDICHCLQLLHCCIFKSPTWKTAFIILIIGIILSHYQIFGFGDSKLLASFSIGYPNLIAPVLCIASAICLLIFQNHHKKIPFAPFLSIGILTSLFFFT